MEATNTMQERTSIGFRLMSASGACNASGRFVNARGFYCEDWEETPAPVSQPDAYRRVALFLTNCPHEGVPRIEEVFQTRELTPIECLSRRLGDVAESYGFTTALGLSRVQIERQLARELVELGALASSFTR
jgi:hypothetical protein